MGGDLHDARTDGKHRSLLVNGEKRCSAACRRTTERRFATKKIGLRRKRWRWNRKRKKRKRASSTFERLSGGYDRVTAIGSNHIGRLQGVSFNPIRNEGEILRLERMRVVEEISNLAYEGRRGNIELGKGRVL